MVLTAVLMGIVAVYLFYTGHVEDSKVKLIAALLFTLGGIFVLQFLAGVQV